MVQTPLWQAVLSGDAFDDVSVRAAEGLAEWGSTFTAGEPDLVLRLIEPELDDNSDPDDDALWRLQVCLRPEGEAPERVRLHRQIPNVSSSAAASSKTQSRLTHVFATCRVTRTASTCCCPHLS